MVFRAVAATVLIVVSLDHAPLAGQNRDGATAPQNGAASRRSVSAASGATRGVSRHPRWKPSTLALQIA